MWYSPLYPIHLRNRDASPVMLAGSQAWHWGFLTHHALFIVQSNRVCKMRITQHEENRGKGTEGRSGGEQRRGEEQRWESLEERDREEMRERESEWTLSEPPFPLTFRLTPRIVFWSLRTAGWRKWIWKRQPGELGRIGLEFASVKCARLWVRLYSGHKLCCKREISGFGQDSRPASILRNEKQGEVSLSWKWFI